MKKLFYTAILLVTMQGLASHVAQAQAPGSTGPTPGAGPAADVPLDGGASLLLASGAAYGLRRLRQRRAR